MDWITVVCGLFLLLVLTQTTIWYHFDLIWFDSVWFFFALLFFSFYFSVILINQDRRFIGNRFVRKKEREINQAEVVVTIGRKSLMVWDGHIVLTLYGYSVGLLPHRNQKFYCRLIDWLIDWIELKVDIRRINWRF